MHTHALSSFALSLDGRSLATGSECDPETDDVEAEHVGIVLWDVATATPRSVVAVEGGVGLGDQLRRGLAFSADGTHLGFNFFGNAVGALDAASGRVVLEAYPSFDDGPPSFAMDETGSRVFVDASEECTSSPDAMGTLFSTSTGQREACVEVDGVQQGWALVFRGGLVHVIDDGALVAVDPTGGREVRRIPLLGGARRQWAWPSPSGRRIATTVRDRGGVALIDTTTYAPIFTSAESEPIAAFVFDHSETRWAAVRERGGGATVRENGRTVGVIPGPLERMDWLGFADGVPVALSPDGREAIAIRPGGALERWSVSSSPARLASLPTIGGAHGVLWPSRDRVIAIGPRVLAFIDVRTGRVRSQHTFPR